MTPGERILQEIIKQGMVSVAYPDLNGQPAVLTWEKTDFEKHLDSASRIVATWPKWKREILGKLL